ncbi:NrdR family transcriptional regulator [Bacillus sp. B-jedd]|uniref:NrdR family transcriptional regulator n=1 Tax=Bacillus sp. B-jedd TaxID=1476857 RepID=UPI000515652D|nr:hypothetical protein [Bacillus sp. B-jedd]CEG25995.1 hypothetical protein BN1002_00833 [Bacillus sp. B-jedd]
MHCPVCGRSTRVKDVRELKHESKSRRRVCSSGHAFRTYEISDERYQELIDNEVLIGRMQKLLKVYDE